MTESSTTTSRIGRGIELSQRGDRTAARALLDEVWHEMGGEDGDPLDRCSLAHAMADLQDDPQDELVWDLRALRAAEQLTDARAAEVGMTYPVAGLFPSLHLNLGDCYRRIGAPGLARKHLRLGLAAAGALPDDGYGRMVRRGLDRLAERLG